MGAPKARYTEEEVHALWASDLPMQTCANQLKTDRSGLRREWVRLFGESAVKARQRRMKSIHRRGRGGRPQEQNPNWKGGVHETHGYRRVVAPDWWTGPRTNGHYVYEHQLVAAEERGWTEIPTGHHVHHVDDNGLNNAPENLQVLTISQHRRHHARA